MSVVALVLQAALAAGEQVQAIPPAAQAASAWLNILTSALTALGLIATAALSILKMLDKAKIKGLEKERAVLTDVATAMAEAVDDIKPLLTSSDAKEVTGAIQRRATAKGVLLPLDTLLAAKGLNQQDRDALGDAPGPGAILPVPPAP